MYLQNIKKSIFGGSIYLSILFISLFIYLSIYCDGLFIFGALCLNRLIAKINPESAKQKLEQITLYFFYFYLFKEIRLYVSYESSA